VLNLVLQGINDSFSEETELVLISGACPTGADKMAEEWAEAHGWTIIQYAADWATFGKRAGFLRNKEMVDSRPNETVAFIRNESKGATMTEKLSRQAAIPTRVWRAA
jgi:hypothetical protein